MSAPSPLPSSPMDAQEKPSEPGSDAQSEAVEKHSASLRGFWSLFVTQFQGAFSDNVLKNLVIFMILGLNVSLAKKHDPGELVTAVCSLPFVFFSIARGSLPDL